jgi:glycosyltransferase involved in cell wall biosynthesis
MKDRLVFLGQVPHGQLYPIIAGARLVVLPSLVDNLPNAMLEAMALGIPVVGTTGASFDEVIEDGRTGFLVTPGDADALAAKVIGAWANPDLGKIGEAARAKMSEFSPEKRVTELVTYLEALVASKGP